MKGIFFRSLLVFSACALAGCSCLREAGRQIWGSSVAHLERVRPDGVSYEMDGTLKDVFDRTAKILTESGAKVYLKDRRMRYLAAMNFPQHVDTTQAGIFFTPIGESRVRLEVASMSPRLVNEVAELLLPKLGSETTAS